MSLRAVATSLSSNNHQERSQRVGVHTQEITEVLLNPWAVDCWRIQAFPFDTAKEKGKRKKKWEKKKKGKEKKMGKKEKAATQGKLFSQRYIQRAHINLFYVLCFCRPLNSYF